MRRTRSNTNTKSSSPHSRRGAVAAEWVLLLGAFGIPMIALFVELLAVLMNHYGTLTFLQALPLP
jgi:hypothetical protein